MSRATPETAAGSDIAEKVTGRARYAADLPGRGAAVVGLVRSPLPHARIRSIDTGAALAVPGVLGVLIGSDFTGFRLGHLIADEPVLAEHRVRYVGEPVAAVAAEDLDAMKAGVEAVRVSYDPLPAALTTTDALVMATSIHDECPDNVAKTLTVERGEWDEVGRNVAVWAEGEFTVQAAQHAYMEPYAALARHERGRVILVAPVHMPYMLRDEYLEWWRTGGEEGFEISPPCIGGSFGAKYEHPIHLICAEFARRLSRDAAVVMSRREDFLTATPRVAMRLRMRLGASADGRLLAKETEIDANNGAYSLHAPSVLGAATVRMDNLYRYEAIRARARLVYTNLPPSQCFRGFGSPQSGFAQEQLVDQLARRLSLTPIEFRRRNAVREGDETVHGWRIGSCGLSQCLDRVEEAVQGERIQPMEAVTPSAAASEGAAGTNRDGRYRVGYGVAAGIHVISDRSISPPGDGAWVRLQMDGEGHLRLFCAEVEVGGGTVRTLTALLAGRLSVPRSTIEIVLGDTARVPYGLGSWASRTSFFTGNAVLDAADRLLERLDALRRELSLPAGASSAAVARAAAQVGRSRELDLSGEYVSQGVEVHDSSWRGNVSPSYTFGVHGCKVRVDAWTGQVEVLRYWAAHDAGTVLNEAGARGQVYGGVLQGLGYALSEDVVVGDTGEVLNPGFLDYRIPTFPDLVLTDVIFVDTYDRTGPLGAKSIAEPPIIPVAACIANAVYDAVGSRLYRLPMTPEAVYQAMKGGEA